MAKLHLPKSWTSFRDMVIMYLFRFIGAPIIIFEDIINRDDPSRMFEGAVCIRFINTGQFPVILDDQEIILPGATYTEGDVLGPGIDHKYRIRFIALPKADAPGEVDEPYVYAGNHLQLRIFKRETS